MSISSDAIIFYGIPFVLDDENDEGIEGNVHPDTDEEMFDLDLVMEKDKHGSDVTIIPYCHSDCTCYAVTCLYYRVKRGYFKKVHHIPNIKHGSIPEWDKEIAEYIENHNITYLKGKKPQWYFCSYADF